MKIAGTILFALLLVGGWLWLNGDERAIRRRLDDIAASVSVPAHDSDFGRLARIAQLRHDVSEDVRIGDGEHEVASRELVLAALSRWTPPPGGAAVEFVDVHVTVAPDHAAATSHLTAKVTTRERAEGAPTVDAREMTVGFRKIAGEWMVSDARTVETLQR